MGYAILGTGAIGGFYGACLQRAGFEVHFLLRSDWATVQTQGLKVESINGDFSLPQVHAHTTPATIPPVDGIIIALKTTQNHQLPALLAPLLSRSVDQGPPTVMTLQNGLDPETDIAQWIGEAPLLGGLCFVCAHKVGPGHIRHLEYGMVRLGQYTADHQPGGVSAPLQRVVQDFQTAGIPVEITPDLRQTRWRKLVWNIPFNGLSVVLNAMTDAMISDANILPLVRDLMAETIAAGNAELTHLSPQLDRTLPADLIEQMIDHTRSMPPYHTSMKLDADRGRPLEVEAILGQPVRAAQAVGVPVARMEMLYRLLRFWQR